MAPTTEPFKPKPYRMKCSRCGRSIGKSDPRAVIDEKHVCHVCLYEEETK